MKPMLSVDCTTAYDLRWPDQLDPDKVIWGVRDRSGNVRHGDGCMQRLFAGDAIEISTWLAKTGQRRELVDAFELACINNELFGADLCPDKGYRAVALRHEHDADPLVEWRHKDGFLSVITPISGATKGVAT